MLVVRREQGGIKRYAHLSTGNYHSRTAKVYTDFGLLTADDEMCQDVHKIFLELTGMGKAARLRKIKRSPFTLHKSMLELIDFEAKQARAGKPARIIVKLNALTEQQIIQALYRASQAGVEIDLIIRGICCLRPGIAGLSENIRVRSIVDRFLEHTRVYYFHNGGEDLVYCSSADWMERNLFNRIETCFPILDPLLKQRVIDDGLMLYLQDNSRAWKLAADGSYQRVAQNDVAPQAAQQMLLDKFCN
jgi:polyphosphate kinase